MDNESRNALPATMLAARLPRKGGPDQIVVEQAPVPSLTDGDVLVAVDAAAITPSELGWIPTWTHQDGSPRTPVIPSHEVAGRVVAGKPPFDLQIGWSVFGLTDFYRDGAAAEYVAVAAASLAVRPAELDPAQAAAIPISAVTAWQGLFDHGHLLPGQRALIHGAAGGVGSFAVQLAHIHGAYVIGVSSESDFDHLRALGANEVLDRHAPSFTVADASIDVVFDTVGGTTIDASWRLLAPSGVLVSVAPSSRTVADTDARGRFFIVAPDRGVLDELARLTIGGGLVVNVERMFPLAEARQAYEYGQQQHPRGKVVLKVR